MSAWIVSKAHIDAMVTYLRSVRPEEIPPYIIKLLPAATSERSSWDQLGQLLWKENHASINYRYGQRERTPVYWFDQRTESLINVFKLCCCYDYQSCEHDAWANSKARRICDWITLHAASNIAHSTPEYDNAPWGL